MHEFDPTDHTQQPSLDAEALRSQAADLQAQDAVIGAEDTTASAADTPASAHDPTAEIPTDAIGNGYDEEPAPAAGLDTVEPAGEEVPDIARVAEDVAPLAVSETVETSTTDKSDTDISSQKAIEQFDRWNAGETVESTSTPIGRVEATDAEIDNLRDITDAGSGEYICIGPEDLLNIDNRATQQRTGLSRDQLATLHDLNDRFLDVVREDADRNGFGQPDADQHEINVGDFQPSRDGQKWHTDRPGYIAARYTLALGDAGTTRFAHGPIQKANTDDYGDVRPGAHIDTSANGTHTETAYDHGVVARFFTSHDVHATPVEGGFRVFFTVTVPINRTALEEEQRRP
jgi:hypothetical protein